MSTATERPNSSPLSSRATIVSRRRANASSQRPSKGTLLISISSPWGPWSWPDHDLDRFAVVHRPVAVGYFVETDDTVEHAAWLDASVDDVREQFLDVRPRGSQPATDRHVMEEGGLRRRDRLFLWGAHSADRAAGAGELDCRLDCLAVADALENGVDAVAVGQLLEALDGLVAAFADDVGSTEFARERGPVGVAAHDDDLLGAEPLGGDDAAESDSAVADDSDAVAGPDLGDDGGVVAGAHHVGERHQGRHQRLVLADRQDDQRAVCLWH